MDNKRKGFLERLKEGLVIGDGGFCWGLEKRGYVTAGLWTSECVVKYPEVVKQYHRDFLRAGSDVMQAFTFYASEAQSGVKIKETPEEINLAACRIAREVANEGDALVSGSLAQTVAYKEGKPKHFIQEEFRKQVQYFIKSDLDLIICEYFVHVEEIEWAIEVAREAGLPVAATISVDPIGDRKDVPTGECAIRMAKAGADIVGVNCTYEPAVALETVKVMKQALNRAGLHPYLMIQPFGFYTPDLIRKQSHTSLLESPYAMESRSVTRFEVAKWARDCYEEGINYLGGCCGFEPYHIRAISEELWKERGKMCQATQDQGFFLDGLKSSPSPPYSKRLSAQYWTNLKPASGRPHSTAFSTAT